jgi:hypothetical protein
MGGLGRSTPSRRRRSRRPRPSPAGALVEVRPGEGAANCDYPGATPKRVKHRFSLDLLVFQRVGTCSHSCAGPKEGARPLRGGEAPSGCAPDPRAQRDAAGTTAAW